MKKVNAFTFVELLMVMLILGIIISLTMPLLKDIINNDDINRAYMKKAIQDVTDATALALLKRRFQFGDASANTSVEIRDTFKLSVSGTDLAANVTDSPAWTDSIAKPANIPGINIGNKSEIYFNYSVDAATGRVGFIYFDVNGKKKPNKACEDRYRFLLYADRATIDPALGCRFELQN